MTVRFVHVGLGNLVQADRVIAVIKSSGSCGKRFSRNAKDAGRFIDTSSGKGVKSLLLLDDGSVMGSMITTKTLLRRLNSVESSDISDIDEDEVEEEEIENH